VIIAEVLCVRLAGILLHFFKTCRSMKKLLYLGMALLMFSCAESESVNTLLNPLIGNQSLAELDAEELARMDETQKVKAHLSHVHDRLLEASAHYPEEVQAKRRALLAKFAAYIAAERYPVNERYAGRRPCFIDAQGTYCAVGHLVKETAGEALAEAINAQHQYDYIADMSLPALREWIAESGFSLHEIAMIQPTYDFNPVKMYHAVSATSDVRNGNTPGYGFSYQYMRYQKIGARGGGNFMLTRGAAVSFLGDGNWSAGYEQEVSVYSIKNIGVSLNSGLGARYLNYDGGSFLQGVPSAALNWVVLRQWRLLLDAGAVYQYGIPLVNQTAIDLNRHAFVFRLRMGYTRV
jgi:hypothetical protein